MAERPIRWAAAGEMPERKRVPRTPRWIGVFLVATAMALVALTSLVYREDGWSFLSAAAALFALLMLAGAADLFTTSVRLSADSLLVTANFRRRVLARGALERVTWEEGVGVSLELRGGRWVKLPYVGNSQSVANSIRAWLKRTEPEA